MEGKTRRRSTVYIVLVCLFLAALAALWYLRFGCPILFFTGVSCPGCGMTRAVWAALHLDFSAAAFYHPLVFLLPLALPVWLLRKRLSPRFLTVLAIVVAALFLIVYLFRLFSGSPIVYARPEEGAILRFLKAVFSQ